MDIIININTIKENSENNESKRWHIREKLLNNKYLYENNKSLFDKYADHLIKHIDCMQCGNCCKENIPVLDTNDINRICKFLNIPLKEFVKTYLHKFSSHNIYIMNCVPCPFLKSNKCSVYEHRFDSCKIYPELKQFNHIVSIGNIIKNYSICPIIFNFYEYLFCKISS